MFNNHRRFAGYCFLLLTLLLFFTLSGTGLAVSDMEKDLARRQYKMFKNEVGFVDLKPGQARQLEEILGRLSREARRDRSDLEFKLEVVNSDVANALYIGDGYVLIFKGLLNELDNKHQIGGVIAHEMGHGVGDDIQENINIIQGIQLGSLLIDVITDSGPGMSHLEALTWTLLKRGYSREQEREADKYAVDLLHRSGYRPEGMVGVLETLQETSGEESESELLELFKSHPHLSNRLEYTGALVRKIRRGEKLYYSPEATGDYFAKNLLADNLKNCRASYTEKFQEERSLDDYRQDKQVKEVRQEISRLKSRHNLEYRVSLRNQREGTARIALELYQSQHPDGGVKKTIALDLIKERYGWRVTRGPRFY